MVYLISVDRQWRREHDDAGHARHAVGPLLERLSEDFHLRRRWAILLHVMPLTNDVYTNLLIFVKKKFCLFPDWVQINYNTLILLHFHVLQKKA